jgi:alpha-tubulin suppressor-like RCC1 family protein
MDVVQRVYVWGSTANGALGCQQKSTKVKVQPVPKSLSPCCANRLHSYITSIAAGNSVTTVVTERNEVYSWGNLSLKSRINTNRVNSCQCNLIPLDGITCIAHGSSYHVAMTIKNEIYAWGDASHCFGTKANSKQKLTKPKRLTVTALKENRYKKLNRPLELVRRMACGEKFTCILKYDGQLLGIGSYGRLNNIYFKEIACGHNHCAAVCSKGSLHTWGWGKNGRLGHGDEEPRTNPTPVSYFGNASFGAVACGYAHTLVSSSEDGSIYGFGWNLHNQVIGNADIGLSDCLLPTICLRKKEVMKLSCGFAHSAAISAKGTLFTWGMNDDGQCGTGDELTVPSPTTIAVPDDKEAQFVVDVSCGHSHTVCILSDLDPLQWEKHVERLRLRPYAIATIDRFARCILFRIRFFNRINRKKSMSKSSITPPSSGASKSEATVISEIDASDIMSSSLSTHTSWSDGRNNVESDDVRQPNNDNDLARRLIEMSRMSDEDQRSQAYMAHLRAMQEKARQQQMLSVEKERVKSERDQMLKEDMISKSLCKQAGRNRMRSRKAIDNASANAQIQKVANRLKEARQRKELQSKAKLELPPISRKVGTNKPNGRSALRKAATNNKPLEYTPDVGHLQRRQKLLIRRDKRLKTKQQLEKEADTIRRQRLKEQQERQRLDVQLKQKIMSDEQKRIEEARRLRRLQRNAEMQRLENELQKESFLIFRSENKENESDSSYRSLSHWTRTLYGQK